MNRHVAEIQSRTSVGAKKLVIASQALRLEVRDRRTDIRAAAGPFLEFRGTLRLENRHGNFWHGYAVLAQEIEKRATRCVLGMPPFIHDQTETRCRIPELSVMVVPLTRFPVCFLPGVQEFVQQSPEDFPWLSVYRMRVVDGNFVAEPKAIVARPKMAERCTGEAVDAEDDRGDFEIKLKIQDLRPTVQFAKQVAVVPIVGHLMLGESLIDAGRHLGLQRGRGPTGRQVPGLGNRDNRPADCYNSGRARPHARRIPLTFMEIGSRTPWRPRLATGFVADRPQVFARHMGVTPARHDTTGAERWVTTSVLGTEPTPNDRENWIEP